MQHGKLEGFNIFPKKTSKEKISKIDKNKFISKKLIH